jgi:hypothetical protein
MAVEFSRIPGPEPGERHHLDIVGMVTRTPGMTAEWYVNRLKTDMLRSEWLYNLFYQAVRSKRIFGFHKKDAGRIFYYPPGQNPTWEGK